MPSRGAQSRQRRRADDLATTGVPPHGSRSRPWSRDATGETTPALLEETIGANLARTVAAHPDAEALVEVASGRRWTWAELERDVDAVARGLLAAGLAKGDRVGIWAPNCAEWTITQYATAKIGVVLVNVNPAYRTHELAYVVNQSGMRLLVAATRFKTSEYAEMLAEVRDDCPALERVVLLDTDDWAALVAEGADLPADAVAERLADLRPHDPINIQYTSGTTGRAQGRDAEPPQHPQQRLPHDRADRPRPRGPAVHPGALLPLLRDGDGQPGLHLPRHHDGDPGAGLRPRDHAAHDRRRSGARASTACRRCSSRCSTTPRSPSTTCRACAPGSWPARSARWR